MKEKKARVEDALHATRAAVEEGIVPGGGVALIRAQKALKSLKLEDSDEQIGVDIIRRAIEEPLRMIVQNAGGEGSIVVEKVRSSKDDKFGYNALTDTYEDLVAGGRHRSDEGDAHGAAERRVDRRPAPHDGSDHRREEGREVGRACRRRRRRRHGRDVLIARSTVTCTKRGSGNRAPTLRSYWSDRETSLHCRLARRCVRECVATQCGRAVGIARGAHLRRLGGHGPTRVADLPASAFRNANGSPRLRDDQYAFVRARIVPLLEQWSRDPRLAIDPAYVTALILKESGGDSLAVSGAPALGHRAAHRERRFRHAT